MKFVNWKKYTPGPAELCFWVSSNMKFCQCHDIRISWWHAQFCRIIPRNHILTKWNEKVCLCCKSMVKFWNVKVILTANLCWSYVSVKSDNGRLIQMCSIDREGTIWLRLSLIHYIILPHAGNHNSLKPLNIVKYLEICFQSRYHMSQNR